MPRMLPHSGCLFSRMVLGALCLCLIVAGCGGGSSSSTQASEEHGSGAEPSAQFFKPGGDNNKIVKFGHEAPPKEREEANEVVEESLKARAAADFAHQCETLNMIGIAEIPRAKGRQDCPAALKKYAEPLSLSKKVRKDTLSGRIAAMRVKGNEGYVLYHGNTGKDYALPIGKEDGSWKVSSLFTIEL